MKGDGGRAACLGEASKLNCSKSEGGARKTNGFKGQGVDCDGEFTRRGGSGRNFKQLEDQVLSLEKQLEVERREQKKLREVITDVIKGERSSVTLDKAENILVNKIPL